MTYFARFARNTVGRDFVVGDIHGCFTRLDAMLDLIGFDRSVDRLFSVGDLVDRGPESAEAINWIGAHWFFGVKGNHEAMLKWALSSDTTREVHISNGAKWFYELDGDRQFTHSNVLNELPYAIEIDTPRGKVGLVHAECPLNDWDAFIEQLPTDGHLQDMALWARVRVRGHNPVKIANVELVISGHTPLKAVKTVENSMFIDTGACFKDGFFTVVGITNDVIYSEQRSAG